MSATCVINKNPMIRFFIRFLPNRMKRLTFLASLAAVAKNTEEPNQEMIQKLNNLLGLASTGDAALKLPISVSSLIWSNKDIVVGDIYLLSKSHDGAPYVLESAERIVNALPTWFLYDNKENIVHDILELFTSCEEMFPSLKLQHK